MSRKKDRTFASGAFLWIAMGFLAIAIGACAQGNAILKYPLRTANSIHALSPAQANRGEAVEIRGVVTQSMDSGMVIHDETAGIWVYWGKAEGFSAGDEVEVRGVISAGKFAPVIKARSVHRLGRSPLPRPIEATFRQLSSGVLDSQYVTIVGSVRSVGIREMAPHSIRLLLRVRTSDGVLAVTVPTEDQARATRLVDAVVRVTGTAMCSKNDNRQIIAPELATSGFKDIGVITPPLVNPFSRPITPIARLMQYRSGTDFYHRVRVIGTVTYYQPGESIILEKNGAALSVQTGQVSPIAVGDRVEAAGFLTPRNSGPVMEDALIRRLSSGPQPKPTRMDFAQICSGRLNFNLISTSAILVRKMREPQREVLLLQGGSSVLLAELDSAGSRDLFPHVSEGSTVRVTGISTLEVGGTWNYGVETAKAVRCTLVLRSPADITMTVPPSWWTIRHLLYLALALGLLALAFLIHAIRNRIKRWQLETVMAERERLTHDIHDTLAQSFAGIGFQLQAIQRSVPATLPRLREQVTLAADLVRHSHREARRSIEPLQPSVSEGDVDLLKALECSAHQMADGGGIEITVTANGSQRAIPAVTASTLLRIGQEAIANVVRHANPTHLDISLDFAQNSVGLSIRDDGVGFVSSGTLLGFGLRGMRRRADSIMAKLDIESRPQSGTRIGVIAPLPPRFRIFHRFLSFSSRLRSILSHAIPNPESH